MNKVKVALDRLLGRKLVLVIGERAQRLVEALASTAPSDVALPPEACPVNPGLRQGRFEHAIVSMLPPGRAPAERDALKQIGIQPIAGVTILRRARKDRVSDRRGQLLWVWLAVTDQGDLADPSRRALKALARRLRRL